MEDTEINMIIFGVVTMSLGFIARCKDVCYGHLIGYGLGFFVVGSFFYILKKIFCKKKEVKIALITETKKGYGIECALGDTPKDLKKTQVISVIRGLMSK